MAGDHRHRLDHCQTDGLHSRARPGSSATASAATTRCWPPWPAAATCSAPACAKGGQPRARRGQLGDRDDQPRAAGWRQRADLRAPTPASPPQGHRRLPLAQAGLLDHCQAHQGGPQGHRQIPADAWTPIPDWLDGGADVAETSYRPVGRTGRVMRLIVRRVRPTPGPARAVLRPRLPRRCHRPRGDTLWREPTSAATPRSKTCSATSTYGVGLNQLPPGSSPPTPPGRPEGPGANLARWTSRIGLVQTLITTKTLRTRYLDLPGRLTRSARRVHLHLPTRWPWRTSSCWRWTGCAASRSRPDLPPPRSSPHPAPPGPAAACIENGRCAIDARSNAQVRCSRRLVASHALSRPDPRPGNHEIPAAENGHGGSRLSL